MTESFTSKDIVSIIGACHKNRVKSIRLKDLSVDFDLADEGGESPFLAMPEAQEIEKTLAQEDPLYESLQQQTLLMEDPAEFERRLMQEFKENQEGALQPDEIERDVHSSREVT